MQVLLKAEVKEMIDHLFQLIFDLQESRMRTFYVYGKPGSSKTKVAYMLSEIFSGVKVVLSGSQYAYYDEGDRHFRYDSRYKT
jgi:hypothetical protein